MVSVDPSPNSHSQLEAPVEVLAKVTSTGAWVDGSAKVKAALGPALESSPSAYHDFEWLMTFHKRAIDQRLGDDFFERTGTTILPLDPFRNDGLPYRYYILPYRGGFAHIVASNGPNRVQDITGDLALRIIEGEDSIEHYIYDPRPPTNAL